MNRTATLLLSLGIACILAGSAHAQIVITAPSTAYTEDFTSLGTSATASLSAPWRIDKDNVNVRTVGSYGLALTATALRAGDNMSSTASNGIYNYAAGDPAAATDRALGWISSSSGTKTGSLYSWYQNGTGSTITNLSISYNVEKYRAGSNAAGFSVQLYYSNDGSTWTSAGSTFLTSFAADPANAGYASAPGATSPVSGTLTVTVTNGNSLYLAWNYSVTSGTTTSNAQGLGIDNVSVSATTAPTLPTVVQFSSGSSIRSEGDGTVSIDVSITNPSPTAATTVDVALTGGTASNGTDIQPAYTTQTLTFPAGSSAMQSVSFTIFDDAVFEGSETAIFSLQNVAGGTTASIGGPGTHTVTIGDNDLPPMPDAVVNEYFNANGDLSSYEAVELLVVKDGLDMRGWSLADATSGGTYPFGTVTFTNDPVWANLPAGTVILVGGTFSVPAVDVDASDGLIIVKSPAGNGSNQYLTAGSSTLSIAGASDAVALRDAGNSFVHGLAHGTANQSTLPLGRHGWLSGSSATGASVAFTRAAGAMTLMDFLSNSFLAHQPYTIGAANDTTGNRDFIRSIRSRVITASRSISGTFYWDVTVNAGTVDQTGPVNVANRLVVKGGTWNENAAGLGLHGGFDPINGIGGAGSVVVGDDANPAASLLLSSNVTAITGTAEFNHTDGTVDYRAAATQTVLPATYFNLTVRNGDAANQKLLGAPATVNGTLSIVSGAYLNVGRPHIITLGPSGIFSKAGRFFGSIRTTRDVSTTGVAQTFGGIGISITPSGPTLPGLTTATMTSGYYTWVGNIPSILRSYVVSAAAGSGNAASMVFSYDDVELNGQTESGLGLRRSGDGGTTWTSPVGTLNTTANTITAASTAVNGIWTMHANPPQGTIVATPSSWNVESEVNFIPLPAPQSFTISNLNSGGSIIEWSAAAATTVTPSWLQLTPSPAAGVNSGTFVATVVRNDLAPGVYTGTITVTDVHATNNPLVIPVSYRVHAPRSICVGGDTIFIKALVKKANPKKAVYVFNCGGTYGADSILWTASTTTSWLSIAPSTGREGQAFVLTANIDRMPPQTLYGAVTITGTHSLRGTPISNSPLTLPVVLEVEGSGDVSAQIGSLSAGGTYVLKSALGHRIAEVTVNSGSLSSLGVNMYPYQLPSGFTRLRYATRYFTFTPGSGPYNVTLTLYYTDTELNATLAPASELRGWRQFPIGGVWFGTTSFSTPMRNSVTITGITDLSGAWAMAAPWTPIPMPLRALTAEWRGSNEAVVQWSTDLLVSPLGYLVERTVSGRNAWQTVGIVSPSPDGTHTHVDATDSRYAYEYRLLAFDAKHEAYLSQSVHIAPKQVTAISADAGPLAFALDPGTPNPIRRGAAATISYALDDAAHTTLSVYDTHGRLVSTLVDAQLQSGRYRATLQSSTLPAGTYFVRLQSGSKALTRKMAIVE